MVGEGLARVKEGNAGTAQAHTGRKLKRIRIGAAARTAHRPKLCRNVEEDASLRCEGAHRLRERGKPGRSGIVSSGEKRQRTRAQGRTARDVTQRGREANAATPASCGKAKDGLSHRLRLGDHVL